MKIRLGVDIACRAPHQASCADEGGEMLFAGHRFRTDPDELETLWARLPDDADEVMVIMEPTRNAWVALAAWFRRPGATVVLVPTEQSADLRAYYNKHAKTDRLDSRVLARLPLLHPEGLHREDALGPGDALKRAVKIRSGLVHRRTTSMARLDALLEIMGPAWISALGSDMSLTALRFLACYGHPGKVKKLGKARLAEFFRRSSRGAWHHQRAAAVLDAADATLRLWGVDGMDFDALAHALAHDIAVEARLALTVSDEIKELDKRIAGLYEQVDPAGIVRSVPGVGRVGAPQIAGRLGDPRRFANLAAVRSFAGLVPDQDSSGQTARAGGPTKAGDSCLREALFMAADHARKIDPDPRRQIPPTDRRGRQAPHVGGVHAGRDVADPASLRAYATAPATSCATPTVGPSRAGRPGHRHRALHHPRQDTTGPWAGHHPDPPATPKRAERAGQERSRKARLFVVDGGKALSKAIRAAFGPKAAIQRCRRHKERNVTGHLPEAERPLIQRKLRAAWANPDPDAALAELTSLARALDKKRPGAAASLREGLADTLTVNRLGVTGSLLKTVESTNPVESMIEIVRHHARRVKRWQHGEMALRWTAAGMLAAEAQFRRVKGFRQLPQLMVALEEATADQPGADLALNVPAAVTA